MWKHQIVFVSQNATKISVRLEIFSTCQSELLRGFYSGTITDFFAVHLLALRKNFLIGTKNWRISVFSLFFRLLTRLLSLVRQFSGSLGQELNSTYHLRPLRKVLMNDAFDCGPINLHFPNEYPQQIN